MEYVNYPNNFFELVDLISSYEGSKAVILPVPYEKTTTFMHGTNGKEVSSDFTAAKIIYKLIGYKFFGNS